MVKKKIRMFHVILCAMLILAMFFVLAPIIPVKASVLPNVTQNYIPPGCVMIDFEEGTEGGVVHSTIPGLEFTHTAGYDWLYADVRSGGYNIYSLTHHIGSGPYVLNGYFCAWLGPMQGYGRIDFTLGTASYFSVLTSTYSGLTIDAYDSNGNFLATSGWASSNYGSRLFTRLIVEAEGMAYVMIHDVGNYWEIDDLVTDAPGVGNRPPIAVAGLDQTLEQTSHAGALVMLDGSGSSDPDDDILTYNWTWSGGSATSVNPIVTFPLGTTTVTLIVSDGTLSATDTVVITVVDTTPPDLVLASAPIVLWPPNHKYHTIEVSDFVISVSDICDAFVGVEDVVITSVSSDEPENVRRGGGDGNTLNDIIIWTPQLVLLRAERQGKGNGRVYTINFAVTDASGNTADGSFQVWVPHDQWFVWMTTDDGPAAGYTEYA